MRKPIIAGNWKLNKNPHEAILLVDELKRELVDVTGVDVVVCPPFVDLSEVSDSLIDHDIALGAQNVFWEDRRSFRAHAQRFGCGLCDHRPLGTPPVFP